MKAKVTATELKQMYENESPSNIARAIISAAMEYFNEDNFYYYDYSLRIAFMIGKLMKDGIITKEVSQKVHDEVASLVNQMIYEAKVNE